MKKLVSLLAITAVVLCGCGKQDTRGSSSESEASKSGTATQPAGTTTQPTGTDTQPLPGTTTQPSTTKKEEPSRG